MQPLTAINDKPLFHFEGYVYVGPYNEGSCSCSMEYLIRVLSKNKIYPKIKYDRQYELIYDEKRNLYVIDTTLEKAFHKLVITLFQ